MTAKYDENQLFPVYPKIIKKWQKNVIFSGFWGTPEMVEKQVKKAKKRRFLPFLPLSKAN